PDTRKVWLQIGSVIFACAITLYFFRKNILGIHESSDKAFKIMIATTIMAGIMLTWCTVTILVEGPKNKVPLEPNFKANLNYHKGEKDDPLGFLADTELARKLRSFKSVQKAGDGKMTVEDEAGRPHTYKVAPDAVVTLDGREVALKDLPEGTPVQVTPDPKSD